MQPMINPKYPGLSVRVADEGFAAYVWGSDFSFEVSAYAQAQSEQAVAKWPLHHITPYRKCYGIDPEEFSSYRDAADSAVFMAYLDDEPVGHVVVSTNWNGYAHIDELAVHAPARRHGVAKALLDVAQFWSRKKKLPGIMLETQNNNLGACRLYERCGYVVGGIDHLRYRGIDPTTAEVAIFWYRLFNDELAREAGV
ncbi:MULTISPECIES: GNAT family N-acetyltransferase [Pseudomonas]|uniref:Acetyltransferase, GNAT family n=1 Tax=Pseudomonas chlororaphis TaxID=587753 RepID=A0AAQ3B911_9PSED|nr:MULTISPECIES: GNAT family N-acetyltransferase [Pseudomonas]AZC30774.1 Streptothricin acetyltransferase [Pseudomonas chlororaphis subsp. piscium]AZC37243.1 Streptothricin acetyltransferase [Pseudomonas chlororaphis subsp. piscium]AZC43790.1 Streptothricin acetyltransferase [Pseudomonas chlororaphis subsp. piscium]AZC95504.1 Streptothricin acetyltransferase [Pseudomonas chlororaphis subsp. piscium]MBP5077314.1 GNAT family N-acetyltransferase [Pseudomonas chlororaphis]